MKSRSIVEILAIVIFGPSYPIFPKLWHDSQIWINDSCSASKNMSNVTVRIRATNKKVKEECLQKRPILDLKDVSKKLCFL